MMVPLFNDSEIGRLKRAIDAGYSGYDLSERFGISESAIHDVYRGHVPLTHYYEPLDDRPEKAAARQAIAKSCNLHLMDLVSVYRPEVLDKFNARIQRRKVIRKAAIDNARIVVEASKPLELSDRELKLTKRSRRIFAAGLRHFSMTHNEMTGSTRTADYVKARQTLMYVIYSECISHESTPSIGRMFNRDHSTVVHAVHKVRALLAQGDKEISASVAVLREVK